MPLRPNQWTHRRTNFIQRRMGVRIVIYDGLLDELSDELLDKLLEELAWKNWLRELLEELARRTCRIVKCQTNEVRYNRFQIGTSNRRKFSIDTIRQPRKLFEHRKFRFGIFKINIRLTSANELESSWRLSVESVVLISVRLVFRSMGQSYPMHSMMAFRSKVSIWASSIEHFQHQWGLLTPSSLIIH